MIRKLLLASILAIGFSNAALAQNVQCANRPSGDSTNACANTRFVQDAISGGGVVSSVSNSDGTLTIGPTVGNVVASINLSHANTWSGAQTFNGGATANALTLSSITGSAQCLHVNSLGVVSGTGSDCGSGGGTPGGTNGQVQYNNSGVFGGFTFAGDCTLSIPNITCTKTNGVPFATVATSGSSADISFVNVGTGAATWTVQDRLRQTFNIFDYGAKCDGATDDTTAIQNTINAAEASTGLGGEANGLVFAPSGHICIVTQGIVINKPLVVEFNSYMWTYATTGTVITVNSVTPAAGTTDWRLYFAGLIQQSGNTSNATSVNASGLTGIRVNTMVFSELKVGVLQGFTNRGLWLDGTGGIFNPQTVLHSHITLGVVVYNGYGIYAESVNAATSSVEGITFDIQNIYANWFNIGLYNTATSSNVFRIGALDEGAPGITGLYNEGGWNTFYIGYVNSPIVMAAASFSNTLTAGNTLATGVVFTDNGTDNHLFSSGVDWPTQVGSYIKLNQISPPVSSVSMGNQQLGFVRSLVTTGSSSGAITLQTQAAAGTYNWNWPTSAGSSGQPLLSGGGGSTAMSFGTLPVSGGGTGDTGTAWTTYTPTLGCGTGTLTSATATGRYKQLGKTLFLEMVANITTNGTCAVFVTMTIPSGMAAAADYAIGGRASAVAGKLVGSNIAATGNQFAITNYDNTYPGANGEKIVVSGVMEIQ